VKVKEPCLRRERLKVSLSKRGESSGVGLDAFLVEKTPP
jgi:hypothetical protein